MRVRVGKLRRFSVTKLSMADMTLKFTVRPRQPWSSRNGQNLPCRDTEYLAEGYDGFDALKRGEFVVDHENGQLMSAIVRKFLLGASYLCV